MQEKQRKDDIGKTVALSEIADSFYDTNGERCVSFRKIRNFVDAGSFVKSCCSR